jgi:HEAT repeat protein
MSSLTRWKWACALLATVAGVSAYRAHRAQPTDASAEPVASSTRGAMPIALRRPIRVSAAQLGVSEDELVARIRGSHSLRDFGVLCAKLSAIGDDAAIDALEPMLGDPRRGVAEQLLGAFAQIGSEHAIDIVVSHAGDDRPRVRTAAIAALGQTQSAKAEQMLLALASAPSDPDQDAAIGALGAMGTDQAIAKLVGLAAMDHETAAAAVEAMGSTASPAALGALRGLVDSPDDGIAALAINGLDGIDDAMIGKLAAIAKTGGSRRAVAAIAALGRTGDAALGVLRDLATNGPSEDRARVVQAIAEIGGDQAIATLGDVLKTGDRASAKAAANGLAALGGDQARELLIESALSERAQLTGALDVLQDMTGDDVTQALLSVVKQGTSTDRLDALPRLLKASNPEALALTVELARNSGRNERSRALRILDQAATPAAYAAELELAHSDYGDVRMSALQLLVSSHPREPQVGELLRQTLTSGHRDDVTLAISMLGHLDSDEARHTLLGVVANSAKDSDLASQAIAALGNSRLDAESKTALLAAAETSPEIKLQLLHQLVDANDSDGIRLAREMVSGGDQTQSAQAVFALAQAETPEAKELIGQAMSSSEPAVRIAAMQTLVANPDEASTDKLLGFLRDPDETVRTNAMQLLGQVGSQRAQDAVLAAAHDGSTDARVAAIATFGNLDDPRATQQLPQLIDDGDPKVVAAAISVAYNAGPEVDPKLLRIVEDVNVPSDVRTQAANMLRERGTELDDNAKTAVDGLVGAEGYGCGEENCEP